MSLWVPQKVGYCFRKGNKTEESAEIHTRKSPNKFEETRVPLKMTEQKKGH